MTLVLISFLGGVLTVAAPCVLPLLPIIIGGSVSKDGTKPSLQRPIIIALSLAASVIIFTLLLKATVSLLGIPQLVWQVISGVIIITLGSVYLSPGLWEKLSAKLLLQQKSNALLAQSNMQTGIGRDIATGAALGPVFNSCSPTYALIIATVLPTSFSSGLINLTAYAIGMAATLLTISLLGRTAINKLGWINSPTFHKAIGLLFVVVGLAIIFGLDKQLQTFILDQGWYTPIEQLELKLRQ